MTSIAPIAKLLGAPRGRTDADETAEGLQDLVLRGLPYRSLEAVQDLLGLELDQVFRLLHLSRRTLSRRRREQRLSPDESDRLARVARIVVLATETLGDEAKAGAWLRRPNRALASSSPLQLLETDLGTRRVEEVLGRISHGVVG